MRLIAGVVKPGQIERYHVLQQENSSCSILIIEDLHLTDLNSVLLKRWQKTLNSTLQK